MPVQISNYLKSEVERLCGPTVSFCWGHTLIDLNLATRTASFDTRDGLVTEAYDLLVAADGIHSAVRTALLEQVGHSLPQWDLPTLAK